MWKRISDKLYKLLVAVYTFLASKADSKQGFSAMNNTVTDYRNQITTNNAVNRLFVTTVGPPSGIWDPDPYVNHGLEKDEEQLTQQVAWPKKIHKKVVITSLCGKLLNSLMERCSEKFLKFVFCLSSLIMLCSLVMRLAMITGQQKKFFCELPLIFFLLQ